MSLIFQNGSNFHKYKVILPNGKTIQFGDKRYQHYKDQTPLKLYSYLDHNDLERRRRYRARHSKIILKDGTPAYKKKYTPAWFSYYYLW